jgi:excisionase family DNA binding protein
VSGAKPPEAYLHGDGPSAIVIVPVRVAAWLASRTRLSEVRISARGTDPEVYAVLAALHRGALEWRTSITGSKAPPQREVATPSKWMSTTQAAGQLGITGRAVRLAIQEGRLPATQVDGRWRITREDTEHYRAARAA